MANGEIVTRLIDYYRKDGPVVVLDSQAPGHPEAKRTLIAARPEAVLYGYGNRSVVRNSTETREEQGNPWEVFRSFALHHQDWLFGYLGYDLKNYIEPLESENSDPVGAPDLFQMVPGVILEIHPVTGSLRAVKGEIPPTFKTGKLSVNCRWSGLSSGITQEEYLTIIDEAKRDIYEGEYYEINLSHQLLGDFEGDPLALFHQMKKVGPVPFAAYIEFDEYAVCCQSPERFLCKRGDLVYSQPIKGTTHRSDQPEEDERLKSTLRDSLKEQAENLMIVDLVRNDLSRIARKGSVEVTDLFEIQSFGTVHQMVSTIRSETDLHDFTRILQACFPMGSMTGAPKIRAMKAIEKLETYRRGIYSGAIGYITPAGDFDFNVVIRTAIINDHRLYYAVGGAITSDSDPEKEWQETITKAKALSETATGE